EERTDSVLTPVASRRADGTRSNCHGAILPTAKGEGRDAWGEERTDSALAPRPFLTPRPSLSPLAPLPSLILPVRIVRVFQVPQRPAAVHHRDHLKVVRGRRRGGGPFQGPG